jgi:hypothetical protein
VPLKINRKNLGQSLYPEFNPEEVLPNSLVRTWTVLFAELKEKLCYVHTAIASHEGNLAFIAMAGNPSAGQRVAAAIQRYAEEHPFVRHTLLRGVRAQYCQEGNSESGLRPIAPRPSSSTLSEFKLIAMTRDLSSP